MKKDTIQSFKCGYEYFKDGEEFLQWVTDKKPFTHAFWPVEVFTTSIGIKGGVGSFIFPDGMTEEEKKYVITDMDDYKWWAKYPPIVTEECSTPPVNKKKDTRPEMYRTVHFKTIIGGNQNEETSGFFHGFFQHQDREEAGVFALVEDVSGKLHEIGTMYMRFSDTDNLENING